MSPLLPLHGESSEDLTNYSQQAHGASLKFFFSQWQMTNTFKQTNIKLTAISQCRSSGELSVSMVLAHSFTGLPSVDLNEKNIAAIMSDVFSLSYGYMFSLRSPEG